MADHTADTRINLHPASKRVRPLAGNTLTADTRNAIALHERGYPQSSDLQEELPRPVVDMSKLSVSPAVTHCPFKDGTTYDSLPGIADVAWSYERPVDEMQAIAGRLALAVRKVTELVE